MMRMAVAVNANPGAPELWENTAAAGLLFGSLGGFCPQAFEKMLEDDGGEDIQRYTSRDFYWVPFGCVKIAIENGHV